MSSVSSLAAWSSQSLVKAQLPIYPPPGLAIIPQNGALKAVWSVPTTSTPTYQLEQSPFPDGSWSSGINLTDGGTSQRITSSNPSKYIDYTTGAEFACALSTEGRVACWGDNSSGQLGIGPTPTKSNTSAFTDSANALADRKVVEIGAGSNHVCAITSEDELFCWGANGSGQLGPGITGSQSRPAKVTLTALPSGTQLKRVTGGLDFTCVLTAANEIYCWGGNSFGQLGVNSTASSVATPTVVNTSTALLGKTIAQIVARESFACALATDGTAACWGDNDNGQVGNKSSTTLFREPQALFTGTPSFTSIALGSNHACGLAATTVWCWGDNQQGQLGNGTTNDSRYPLQVSSTADLAGAVTTPPTTRLSSLALGANASCVSVVRLNGSNFDFVRLDCWGSDTYSLMRGGGSKVSPTTIQTYNVWAYVDLNPVFMMNYTVCVPTTGYWGTLCHGRGDLGELGDGSYTTTITNPTGGNLPTSCDAAAVVSPDFYCSLVPGRTYYYRVKYTLNGVTQASAWVPGVPLDRQPSTLTATSGYSSIPNSWTVADGAVTNPVPTYTIRRSTSADGSSPTTIYTGTALTYTDTSAPTSTNWTDVSVGESVACGVTAGRAYCWGNNRFNGLGTGQSTTSNASSPVLVAGLSSETVTGVAVGSDDIACAVTSTKKAYCWGNAFAAYGSGATSASATAVPAFTSQSGKITRIDAGDQFACVLNDTGKVWCAGRNDFGQVGNGSLSGTPVSTATQVEPSGTLGSLTVTKLSVGASQSCVVIGATAIARCWGKNDVGQLGNNSTTSTGSTVAVSGLTTVAEVSAGGLASCARKNDSTIWCWGNNSFGQLGNGTTTSSLIPVKVKSGGTGDAVTGFSQLAQSPSGRYMCGAAGLMACWGNNDSGQFGLASGGTSSVNSSPVTSAFYYSSVAVFGNTFGCFLPLTNEVYAGNIRCSGALTTPATNAGIGTGSASATTPTFVTATEIYVYYYNVTYNIGSPTADIASTTWVRAAFVTPTQKTR
ncbi:MAG TPA: hypothetical protein VK139_06340 [Microbacteriaceae bacterium]|nr:hypothetical protein [Microbacteriaceae bacterium]